jgi:hypothetical protein
MAITRQRLKVSLTTRKPYQFWVTIASCKRTLSPRRRKRAVLRNAIDCGLLPRFREEQIQLVGNTSLAGAAIALLDRNTLEELRRAREGVEIVELNLQPSFEDTYLDQLMIP